MHSPLPVPVLSRRMLRHIDWAFIALGVVTRSWTGSYAFSSTITAQILMFDGLFVLLSLIIPVGRPLWERRVYIGLNMLVFIAAAGLGMPSLMMYWAIAKSCFLLHRREVVVVVILTGIGYYLAWDWVGPHVVAVLRSKGEAWLFDHQRNMLSRLIFYVSASCFTVLFSFVVMAQQEGRRKAEALTQQVKSLATALERARIAREIHDALGHALTTLDVQLELAQRLYHRDPEGTEQALASAKRLTHQCLTEVRRSVQTMRASAFDLSTAVEQLVQQAQNLQGLTIHQHLNLPQLSLQTSHQLYCIIQEGLTNVHKHAAASVVTLTGNQDDQGIWLELKDDGQGFHPQHPQTGFGLRGMQERTLLLGGHLTIESSPGQGTRIRVVIPKPT